MALHELGSNAMKYGARSGEHGQVKIQWKVRRSDAGEGLHLTWTETGGPEILDPPTSEGFGSAILRRLAPAALGGSANLSFRRSGLVWELHGRLASRAADAVLSASAAV
jgi:two-component sensor histidine kinase